MRRPGVRLCAGLVLAAALVCGDGSDAGAADSVSAQPLAPKNEKSAAGPDAKAKPDDADRKGAAAEDSQPDASSKTKSGDANASDAGDRKKSDKDDGTPGNGEEKKAGEDDKKAQSAVKFTLQEQSEVWADLAGGGRRGTSYNGLTTAILDVDLDKSLGWKKGRFYVSAFDIHGHGPSRALVGSDQIVSNIEATPSVKLYDLWLEQRFFGTLYIRAGQEGANDEMMISAYSALYLNSSFGFPALPAADLPSGGPNYPLATPFVRARWKATDKFTVVGAVYNGDPAPPGAGDPQIRDRNGTAFRVNGNSYSFAEFRYAPDPEAPETLATTYKLGAWYHSGRFDDRRIDQSGNLLADPSSSGLARKHRGDYAIYGIVDQVLWRAEGSDKRGVAAFMQVQAAPRDRNLSDLSIDAGINWKGPFQDRPDDVAGIALTYLGISPAARAFSRDLVAVGRAASPFAGNETIIEATYKAPITDWLTLQPDLQYVLNPNAGIPGPFGTKPLPSALVIGIRATVTLAGS